ncbi:MAG: DUF934 domain-containing protein [Rhodospirillaceae bacterium]|nr:DUF934 domain-containing protein [Rhodospirillaceae bacterium]
MPVFDASGLVDDHWIVLGDADPLPAGAPVLLTWERIARDGEAAFAGRDPRGVAISSDFDVAKLLPLLPRIGLVVVKPANFKDGRVFSVGRLLRQRYGFNGDLRIQGEFIPDQVPFLVRCGYSSFEAAPGFDLDAALRLLKVFAFNYQTGLADKNIFALRHNQPAAGRA